MEEEEEEESTVGKSTAEIGEPPGNQAVKNERDKTRKDSDSDSDSDT